MTEIPRPAARCRKSSSFIRKACRSVSHTA